MDTLEYKLELAQTRSRLKAKAILQPVKAMIEYDLWTKTKQDNNYLLGRTKNIEFLEALKRLDNISD